MKNIKSNSDINWGKCYDFYEIEFRDNYRTISKPQNNSHFEMLKTRAKKYLKRENTFCEIGFSAGLTLRYATEIFSQVYGRDISEKNIEYTQKELHDEGIKNVRLFHFDLMKKDRGFEGKFDVISFIHGLEHFANEDYKVILDNIKYYLKKDGIFTGALPYKNIYKYRMCPNCEHVFEIDGHISSHDLESITDIFVKNGFQVIYLNNFNLKYYLSASNFIMKFLKFLYYKLKKPTSQIEYIVKPNNS